MMTIKKRLGLSYAAMLIIPIVLTTIAGMMLNSLFLSEGGYQILKHKNPVEVLLDLSQRVSWMVNSQILDHPDKFMEASYIEKMQNEIGFKNAGLIVRKDNDILYVPKFLENKQAQIQLMPFKGITTDEMNALNKQQDIIYVRLQDFYFSDRSEGSVYLAFDTVPLEAEYFKLRSIFIIFAILSMIIANGILTLLVYHSIMKPLKELEHASNAIKEGNFNYRIKNVFNDEFGAVISSFEGMREQLKKSLQVQHQYEENRKILLTHISHDLKTPITSIKGYIEGIRDGVADTPEKMKKYIDTIYRKAGDMNELIDNLFLFSKLDLQKYHFDFKIFDIVHYIKDMAEELQFDLQKKAVVLDLEYPDKEISVIGDGNNLRRVILNIIDNAIKYAGQDQIHIFIRIKEMQDHVLLEFKDNGKGISKEAQSYVFDEFYRADPSRNMNTYGSGLGLAIIKKIIEEHGGKVWIESEIHCGTSIFFTLRKVTKEGVI
ncbi:sensor histidine kinase [Geosporobacter ferrireducens]|uniref:sensor histidine kinase n=1 Tax=Geosporobacter ferrireducens TaxID=1424294 RepID=UPI00139DD475|nr:HAMP domain-containing sensor histidine kinase [Geosporobacter ferrireducens]MTI57072.1 HAMP domain-containing histidine kinase [Geosporobacter ferrireducens]